MTRRETMVAYLRGENGFSSKQLAAAFAVPGVTEFLTEAQTRGISNADLATELVNFKLNGGVGLQNAIESITATWNKPAVDPKVAVYSAIDALRTAIEAL